jgi:hypothetical protein
MNKAQRTWMRASVAVVVAAVAAMKDMPALPLPIAGR